MARQNSCVTQSCKLYISVKQYKLSAEQGLLLSKRTIHTQLLLRIRNYSSLPQTLCLQTLERNKSNT